MREIQACPCSLLQTADDLFRGKEKFVETKPLLDAAFFLRFLAGF
jgi:hypothetical protein